MRVLVFSFHNWSRYAEIQHHCPTANIVCIGTKIDLLKAYADRAVPEAEVDAWIKSRNICAHVRNSSLTQENLKHTFDTLIRAGLNTSKISTNKNSCCDRIVRNISLCCALPSKEPAEVSLAESAKNLQAHTKAVWCVATEGNRLWSGSVNGELIEWNLATAAVRRVLVGHTDQVNAVVVAPEDHMLHSCSRDGR